MATTTKIANSFALVSLLFHPISSLLQIFLEQCHLLSFLLQQFNNSGHWLGYPQTELGEESSQFLNGNWYCTEIQPKKSICATVYTPGKSSTSKKLANFYSTFLSAHLTGWCVELERDSVPISLKNSLQNKVTSNLSLSVTCELEHHAIYKHAWKKIGHIQSCKRMTQSKKMGILYEPVNHLLQWSPKWCHSKNEEEWVEAAATRGMLQSHFCFWHMDHILPPLSLHYLSI